MRRDTNKMNSKISLICLMTMISLSFGFPDRTQHNHNNHYDWQTHVLNIILHKNLTSQSTSTSLVPHPINVQSTGVTVSSAKTNDEQTEVDFKHIQASDGMDYGPDVGLVLGITAAVLVGLAFIVGMCIFWCIRVGLFRKETKGFVVSPSPNAHFGPTVTPYQAIVQTTTPADDMVRQSPPPPYEIGAWNQQGQHNLQHAPYIGIENPGFRH